MGNLSDNLFWHRFRPNSISKEKGKISMILLPRIQKLIENGINLNFIFYGSGGLGKTTLAKILTENTDCLKIDCSIDNGIDIIREQVEEHCSHYGIFKNGDKKVIWLDEFDGATRQMRESLRGFIEKHIENVRFIATANNIAKISKTEEDKALLSRFNLINFDPIDENEKQFLIKNQISFLSGICKNISYEVNQEILEKIVKINFPNFRKSVQVLQEIYISKDLETFEKRLKYANSELYDFILNGINDPIENINFVMENYKDRSDDLILQLGRPFFSYLIENKPEIIKQNGYFLLKLSKDYNWEYEFTIDPEIHLSSYVTEIKNILNKKE